VSCGDKLESPIVSTRVNGEKDLFIRIKNYNTSHMTGIDKQQSKDEKNTGRNVDKLISTEIRLKGNLPDNVVDQLYTAALEEEGKPLTFASARSLSNQVEEGDTVIVATGAGGPPWLPKGETDGPLGAVGLAHALAISLGARPIITAEERSVPSIVSASRACGLNAVPVDQLRERRNSVTVTSYPVDEAEGVEAAGRFLGEYDPTALIAVEKGAPNAEGVYHSTLGSDVTSWRAKIAPLFDQGAEAGLLSIGIGDNGNEIGFGRIESDVRTITEYGDVCQCACGGGPTASRRCLRFCPRRPKRCTHLTTRVACLNTQL